MRGLGELLKPDLTVGKPMGETKGRDHRREQHLAQYWKQDWMLGESQDLGRPCEHRQSPHCLRSRCVIKMKDSATLPDRLVNGVRAYYKGTDTTVRLTQNARTTLV